MVFFLARSDFHVVPSIEQQCALVTMETKLLPVMPVLQAAIVRHK